MAKETLTPRGEKDKVIKKPSVTDHDDPSVTDHDEPSVEVKK